MSNHEELGFRCRQAINRRSIKNKDIPYEEGKAYFKRAANLESNILHICDAILPDQIDLGFAIVSKAGHTLFQAVELANAYRDGKWSLVTDKPNRPTAKAAAPETLDA